MSRVLVVHHDVDMADQEVDWLRHAGHLPVQCAGPTHGPCPIFQGLPCPAVDDADVLVYDVWASGDSESERELIKGLRELHPNIPIVLTAPGMEFDWIDESEFGSIVTLEGAPTSELLVAAVERALAMAPAA
jgi:DNA-binding NtrC family response regulator